jgi:hypothetical protein
MKKDDQATELLVTADEGDWEVIDLDKLPDPTEAQMKAPEQSETKE